jgi:hypothetical protein
MTTVLRFAAVCVVVGLAVGLAGAAPADAKTTNDLKQIGLAYHNYHAAFNKGPSKVEDLAEFLENDKRLIGLLKDETIVFFFGVSIEQMTAGTSNTVLAYVKEVPDKGGLVLMGDGSVKKLSADEFAKATKAGKVKEKEKDK